jgi:exonuclease SbcC
MKIKRVKLNNFAQHKNVDVSFDEKIIGIIGRNGSGKSNFANAISVGITGEFGKKKKKDIITFGQTTGNIYLEGDIRGSEFIVDRSLDSNKCTLKYKDEFIEGADDVNSRLLEILGCDKSFLPNMVFVSQTDILGILFGRPTERNKMLQKYFGLEKAAKLELLLGQWKSNISYPALIDENQTRNSIKELEAIVSENDKEIEIKKSEIDSITQELSGIDIELIIKNYKESSEKEKITSEISLITKKIEEDEILLQELKPPAEKRDEIDSLKDRLAKIDVLIGSKKTESDLLSVVCKHTNTAKSECCPLCNSELDSLKVEEFSLRLSKVNEDLSNLILESQEVKLSIRKKESNITSYESNKYNLKSSIKYNKDKLEKIQKNFDERKFPKYSKEKYLDGINYYRQKDSDINKLNSEIKILDSTNEKLKDQINTLLDNSIEAKKIKSIFTGTKIHESRISRIRDIFRHDNISGKYVNAQMQKMCCAINDYLISFGAEYKVKVAEDNEFICIFKDKHRPAADLSCGQKVVLSLAFRFASCETFSTGVNMIVLDEPTTWLDRETIANFKTIIENITELSEANNLQVLMVTHERSLIPYFRQTIEF